jgi:hypothetical protein
VTGDHCWLTIGDSSKQDPCVAVSATQALRFVKLQSYRYD